MANYLIVNSNLEILKKLLENKVKQINNNVKIDTYSNPDIHFCLKADDSSFIGIDDIKAILKNLRVKPFQLTQKTLVILPINSLTKEAQNSLLKDLEDDSLNVNFIMGADNLEGVLPTIISRSKIEYSKEEYEVPTNNREAKSFLYKYKLLDSGSSLAEKYNLIQKEKAINKSLAYEIIGSIGGKDYALIQRCSDYLNANISPKQVLIYFFCKMVQKMTQNV